MQTLELPDSAAREGSHSLELAVVRVPASELVLA